MPDGVSPVPLQMVVVWRAGWQTVEMARRTNSKSLHTEALEFALGLPGAWEDHPWDSTVVKVGKKIFVFLGGDGEQAGATVKLTGSHNESRSFPGAAPSGYGLGKTGWVTVPFGPKGPPTDLVCDWIEESYRQIAIKKLIAQLDASGPA